MKEFLKIYEHNVQVVDFVERYYGTKVMLNRLDFYDPSIKQKRDQYNLSIENPAHWNAIVVNSQFIMKGNTDQSFLKDLLDSLLEPTAAKAVSLMTAPSGRIANVGDVFETDVNVRNAENQIVTFRVALYCDTRVVDVTSLTTLAPGGTVICSLHWNTHNVTEGSYEPIVRLDIIEDGKATHSIFYANGYLEVKSIDASASILTTLGIAFWLGFFDTLSPCLILMLSFVLGYAMGDSTRLTEGFSKVVVFGLGFLIAALFLGLSFGLLFLSLSQFSLYLTIVVSAFFILFGLNLIGVFRVPFETKPILGKITRTYARKYVGLFLLGFAFYFLDPCMAPILVGMATLQVQANLPLILLVFCVGVLVPFLAIGISTGSISRLVRASYKMRSKVKAIWGLILVGYSLYIVFSAIMSR